MNKRKTKKWILSDIAYEEAKGVHTYHLCSYCKKNQTRSGKCAECLKKDLTESEVSNDNSAKRN